MSLKLSKPLLAAGLAVGALALFAVNAPSPAAEGLPASFQGGHAGFVVSDIGWALSHDAAETGACAHGMSQGYANYGDVFVNRPDLQRGADEAEQTYLRRMFTTAFTDGDVKNLCHDPQLGHADPNWRMVSGNVPAEGIDLDGQDSRANGHAARNTCAHDDFRGFHGEHGIDNQFFRVVGCSPSYQSTGSSRPFAIEMLTGAWGILITLDGVDNIQNDPDVRIGIYANADPIELSPNRVPLANATYAMDQDPRFRATAHARIVNGVLISDPVNVRFHKVTNGIYLDRTLDDARVQMHFTADGGLDGYLAGYASIEDAYDSEYGFRNGRDANGQPASPRLINGSALGKAFTLHHTCNGAYYALQQAADGHRDPATGRCSAISTQYRVRAIPAFVVDRQTGSVNDTLNH